MKKEIIIEIASNAMDVKVKGIENALEAVHLLNKAACVILEQPTLRLPPVRPKGPFRIVEKNGG